MSCLILRLLACAIAAATLQGSAASKPNRAMAQRCQLPWTMERGGDHEVRIQRVATSRRQRRAIRTAEGVPCTTGRDWSSPPSGIESPYPCAITSGVVRYFVGLSDCLAAGGLACDGPRIDRSRLAYLATARSRAELLVDGTILNDVVEVKLEFHWSQYGAGEVYRVSASRVIVLNRAGTVVHVNGDGEVLIGVS